MIVYVALGVLILAALVFVLVRTDAARLAHALRIVGPVLVGLGGLVLLFLGRAALGGALLSLAAGWWAAAGRRKRATPSPGRTSAVRTAALEMELDHDTGSLDGVVLAGRHQGRRLGELELPDLLALLAEVGQDGESRQLLETYLDGRFPVWRHDAQADGGDREARPPRTGAMTKQEAYQILGLEAGAGAADIRKAHRRLMQRLHPDLGGSSFLAARINEAKDVLLSGHD